MPGTFCQIYIQIVFAVRYRQQLLLKPWRHQVFRYMAGVIEHKGHKSFIINGVEDHVHLLISLTPSTALSGLVRDIKNNTTNFINERGFVEGRFAWQEGYGAFSYSASEVDKVYRYILNQEQHHQKIGFEEEYIDFLTTFKIEYDTKFLFHSI
jgi:putative transposase